MRTLTISIFILGLGLLAACGGGDETNTGTANNTWTWVSGADTVLQAGSYGDKGVTTPTNMPEPRQSAMTWYANGNLWLFGGLTPSGTRNDLWRFDGTNWTWVSGSNITNQAGTYNDMDANLNHPGARLSAHTWVDNNNNLWLFGGFGNGSTTSSDVLNDLWKFDGNQWTWVSGSDVTQQSGFYGTQGQAGTNNIPGARDNGVTWIDAQQNLWLFGGYGYDENGTLGVLNDLWKFDGTNWIWISGSNLAGQTGSYGSLGITVDSNVPGARTNAVAWRLGNDLYLFGGSANGHFNDLWKFNGSRWTWIAGSNGVDQAGDYGTLGTAAATNSPGSRLNAVAWVSAGRLWLFGGRGRDRDGTYGYLNDLWMYNGNNWVWVKGSDLVNQAGAYGIPGEGNSDNNPGGRRYHVSWTDNLGNLWMFGGRAYDRDGVLDDINDLWLYRP